MNRNRESPRPSSGPRACKPCAASKARCIFTPEAGAMGGKCSRCNRLNKDCVLQTAAVRTRRSNQPSRVSQSEDRVGHGVSHLGASQQLPTPRDANDRSAILDYLSPIVPSEYHVAASASSQHTTTPQTHQSASTPSTASAKERPQGIDIRDPETILNFYRNNIADKFPFVVITPSTTAYALSRDKPLLFKAIVMVASAQDVKAQAAMAEEIVEYLSLHLLLRSEKSLDMLQGLLVFMGWHHAYIHLGRRLATLLQLSEALIVDLDLNREPNVAVKAGEKKHEFWVYSEERVISEKRSLEERRAFLGLIYLTSISSLYVLNMEPTRYMKYTENCVEIIRDIQEYPSDQYLLQLMKLQNITREISETLPRENFEPSLVSGPAALFIQKIHTKLDVFQERVPMHLRGNPFLLMHYHCILVYLTETALYSPTLPSRVATLHACLTSIISFFSALFSVPTLDYYKCIYPIWIQMMYSLGVLSKLSLFESNDWDLSHVGRMFDLSIVLEGMIGRLGEVMIMRRQMAGAQNVEFSSEGNDDGLVGKVIPQFRKHQETFEKRRQEIRRRAAPATPFQTATIPNISEQQTRMTAPATTEMMFDKYIPDNHFDISQVYFSQLDDAFWQDFMGNSASMSGENYIVSGSLIQ